MRVSVLVGKPVHGNDRVRCGNSLAVASESIDRRSTVSDHDSGRIRVGAVHVDTILCDFLASG